MNQAQSGVVAAQGFNYRFFLKQSEAARFSNEPSQIQANLDTLLGDQQVRLKHDKTTTVAKVSGEHSDLIIKRYNARNFWHHIKRAMRESRAHRCWRMSASFTKAGLNVAEPVMMFEQRFALFRRNAYFVSRCLTGHELLGLLPNMDAQEQALVKQAVTQAFSAMREHLITHGDMKASNLLWVNKELYFVDLDAARNHKSHMSWQHSHNKDRKRFLKNWQNQPELLELFNSL